MSDASNQQNNQQPEAPKDLMQLLSAFDNQHNKIMDSMQSFIGTMTKDMAGKLGTYMTGLYTTLEHQSQELVLHRTFEAGLRASILTQEDVQQILTKLVELRKAQADVARKFLSEANTASSQQPG